MKVIMRITAYVDNDYIYNLIEKGIIVKNKELDKFQVYQEDNYYHKMRPNTGKKELNEYRTVEYRCLIGKL